MTWNTLSVLQPQLPNVAMSETLLALVALLITTFFVFTQQRGLVQAERELASVELEVLAHAVGSEVMEQIAAKPFDAATIGINPQSASLNDLTPSTDFGNGLDCPDVCDDIDDFNHMQPDSMFFEVDRDEADEPFGFDFVVTARVRYIDAAGVETSNRTWMKEVTLFIDQAIIGSQPRYLRRPIEMKQQFSLQ